MTIQFDAQAAYGFVVSQRAHIETQVNETVYADIQYQNLIPVDTSANPMAKTVTYYSSDKYGQADWINGNSNDIPRAGTTRMKHDTSVHTAAIGYGYGWEEIRVAQQTGSNLMADDAMAARRAYEEMVDRVALRGDASKGFEGLLGNSSVGVGSATNGSWATASEDDILKDVNDALLSVAIDTQYASVADTLLLPYEDLNRLATKRLGDTGKNLLTFLRENNTFTSMTQQPLTLMGVRGLETAGQGGTRRMIAYRRDPMVLKLHIPMPHQFLGVYQSGALNWEVPGVFRLGGLDIRRPREIRYIDGI